MASMVLAGASSISILALSGPVSKPCGTIRRAIISAAGALITEAASRCPAAPGSEGSSRLA